MKIASRNPPHLGEIIKGLWLDPMGVIQAAKAMGVSRKTLSKIINKQGLIGRMAIRLSLVGSSPESWLGHQTAYDLWQAEQRRIEPPVMPLFATAAAAA